MSALEQPKEDKPESEGLSLNASETEVVTQALTDMQSFLSTVEGAPAELLESVSKAYEAVYSKVEIVP